MKSDHSPFSFSIAPEPIIKRIIRSVCNLKSRYLLMFLLATVQAKHLFEVLLCADNINKWIILWTFECDSFRDMWCEGRDWLPWHSMARLVPDWTTVFLQKKVPLASTDTVTKGAGKGESHSWTSAVCTKPYCLHEKCSSKVCFPWKSRRCVSGDCTQIIDYFYYYRLVTSAHLLPSQQYWLNGVMCLLCFNVIHFSPTRKQKEY